MSKKSIQRLFKKMGVNKVGEEMYDRVRMDIRKCLSDYIRPCTIIVKAREMSQIKESDIVDAGKTIGVCIAFYPSQDNLILNRNYFKAMVKEISEFKTDSNSLLLLQQISEKFVVEKIENMKRNMEHRGGKVLKEKDDLIQQGR
jgi:histone H3/H4